MKQDPLITLDNRQDSLPPRGYRRSSNVSRKTFAKNLKSADFVSRKPSKVPRKAVGAWSQTADGGNVVKDQNSGLG
jgi:hypothetical protein